MLDKPIECNKCVLAGISTGFSNPEGTGSIPMLIVGESLGYNEAMDGLPFRPYAQAGSILQRIIQEKAKFNRSQFAFWNLVACHPPQDKLGGAYYEYEAINHCRVHFDRVIDKYNPRVILACGALPFKHLVGLEGKSLGIEKVRGYVFESSRYSNILVLPTYHPSFIRRGNAHLMGVLLFDFMKAIKLAQGKTVDYLLNPIDNRDRYITKPKAEDALAFLENVKNNPDLRITYDIETDKSAGEEEDELEEYGTNITQIQFSIGRDSGIALPYKEPFITIAKSILDTPNPKCGHNCWDFDNPILYREGMKINGRVDDTMWMFHHYQADLPLGLQTVSSFYNFPFAWKHFANLNNPFYGIADVDSLHYIYNPLVKQLKDRGLYDGYEKFVFGLKPILIDTQDRGLPINDVKREAFSIEIDKRKEEIEVTLSKRVPKRFTTFHPPKGYKNLPNEYKQKMVLYCVENKLSLSLINLPSPIIAEAVGLVVREFEDVCKACGGEGKIGLLECPICDKGVQRFKRYCQEIPFNPLSPDQVSNYIKENGHEEIARKLAIKISKDELEKGDSGKDNVSTSKNVLLGLAHKTGDETYGYIVEYKELSKMGGTYVDGYASDGGRVHTTFTFRPSSGQLSSRKPNIQNYPVHTRLADKFKEVIEAKEGHLLVSLDYRGFHNKMMGYLAGDDVYERLAGLDTHSYLTGYVVGWPFIGNCLNYDDEHLGLFLADIKKAHKRLRDDQVKHVVHGINFGLSEKGCYDRYGIDFNPTAQQVLKGKRKVYKGEALAKLIEKGGRRRVSEIYDILRGLFPKIFKWQEQTIVEADKGWLDTPYGFRRWFPAASEIRYDKYGNVAKRTKGEQAEEALAFPISNCAHCHMRESMIILDNEGFLEKYRLVNMIHDSLIFEVEEGLLEEAIRNIRIIMERESEVLRGFWCKVDVKIGKNMLDMREL